LLIFAVPIIGLSFALAAAAKDKKPKPAHKTALDVYVEDAHAKAAGARQESPGSLWSAPASLGDLALDLRARNVDDLITIVVNEQASAASTGTTKTSRASSANSSITAAVGPLSPTGRLSNLWNSTSNSSLNGQGTTSRQTTLSTTIAARVIDVLPNGYLVIQGNKSVMVNSENQLVTIRGVVRPTDLSYGNMVQSDNVAQMELNINGRGVVNDVIHRPNFLYRLLLGALPF
jgi:flagellar L-ring protein precursor FlgH